MPIDDRTALDERGRPKPEEYECQLRESLGRTIEQPEFTRRFEFRGDRNRRDLWGVDQDGSNIEEVAQDICLVVRDRIPPLISRWGDLEQVFLETVASRDCFYKFVFAAHLAKRLGRIEQQRHFKERIESEGARIGVQADRLKSNLFGL